MYDFIVIGDITVDHIIPITQPTILESIDTESGSISFSYPNKVRLTTPPQIVPGGNAYTVSNVINKLGLQTAIYSVIGQDNEGAEALNYLRTNGINTDLVAVDGRTNNSFVLSVKGDRVIFSYHHPRTYQLPLLPPTKYVYLTSIGENDKHLFDQLLNQKQHQDFKLIFAPGTLQLEEDIAEILAVLEHTEVLIINKYEASLLLDQDLPQIETLLKEIKQLGPQQVLITDGKNGAWSFDGDGIIHVPALVVDVKDNTGAGDTYAATFISATLLGMDTGTAMQWATINAANIVQEIGLQKQQLHQDQILTKLTQLKELLTIKTIL